MSEMTQRNQILQSLKWRGPQTSASLAEEMGLTVPGVRRHLTAALKAGFLRSYRSAETVGRPKQYWELTERAQGQFPDRHAELTVNMIEQVREVFGEKGMNKLIKARENQIRIQYRREMADCVELGERVQRLAQLRTQEGYMAEAQHGPDDTWILIENHCPICSAAKACLRFCRSELDIFRECLDAEVTRVETIMDGARRCTYSVVPKK